MILIPGFIALFDEGFYVEDLVWLNMKNVYCHHLFRVKGKVG